jgi:hypothetical protein
VPSRTNTDRIIDAEKEIIRLSADFENGIERLRSVEGVLQDELRSMRKVLAEMESKVNILEARLAHVERFDPKRVAVLEERCAFIEKLLDEGRTRRWQVWLAVLGAILSAVIALIVALIKK